ncbi:MAG: hypothetical protein WCJ33_03870, partial [Pseudomonadota bacterium]
LKGGGSIPAYSPPLEGGVMGGVNASSQNNDLHKASQNFNEIRKNYILSPEKTMKYFNKLLVFGDSKQKDVLHSVNNTEIWQNGLFWLDKLGNNDFSESNFANFPETIIIHGKKDKVIYYKNAEKFMEKIPNAKLFLLEDSAHAIYLHANKITKIINV